jgi:GNAT superfamily N-acetyltransferase
MYEVRYPLPVEIRAARPEEYEEAGRVTADAYREFAPPGDHGWETYLGEIADVAGRAGRTWVLVAAEDGAILGSATVEMDDRVLGDDDEVLPPEMACLRMLGVDPAARGRGVGRALVDGSIDLARAQGKSVMTLRTTDTMHAARRLYRSMGFEPDPARDVVFDSGFRLIAFRLAI